MNACVIVPAYDAARTLAIEGTVGTAAILCAADAEVGPEFEAFTRYDTLVACGRMHEQKGFDFLIQRFAELRRTLPNARLLLVGDGPRQTEYLTLAQGLGLRAGSAMAPQTEDVSFAGYRAHPSRYYRLGKAWAMTSRYEGLPNSLIEALGTGVPLLAADFPWGARSILAGDATELAAIPPRVAAAVPLRHGVLLPRINAPGAAAAWTEELRRVLTATSTRASLEQRRKAVARFDIRRTAPRWLDLVTDLASCQSAAAGQSPHD